MSNRGPRFKLLTTNIKLLKSSLTYGLSLAPANTSGYEVCPGRTAGCTAGCVAHTGYARVFPSITAARIAKTRRFFEDREGFLAELNHDLRRLNDIAKTRRTTAYVRLNTFSDIGWENLIDMASFSHIIFYDYTKVWPRMRNHIIGKTPSNYYLTWSVSEGEMSEALAIRALQAGCNAAVPFDVDYKPAQGIYGPLPERWNGYPVVDGDRDDRRIPIVDGRGVVIGLRFKGGNVAANNARSTGFNRTAITVDRRALTA